MKSLHGATSGIDQSENLNINVFPNPFTDVTTFDFNVNEKVILEVYNQLGELISYQVCNEKSQFELNGEQLESGMYFYMVFANGNILKTGKLIKL